MLSRNLKISMKTWHKNLNCQNLDKPEFELIKQNIDTLKNGKFKALPEDFKEKKSAHMSIKKN